MQTQTTIFDDTVADWISALLARCDAIRLGSTLARPHVFDDAGEAHAREVAERDRESSN